VVDRNDIAYWLTDMDGVLVHENKALPGAPELIRQWRERGTPFLVLTNNSIFTPRDLSARLRRSGLDVPEEQLWTSALATAAFLKDQSPGGSAFVMGEAGLTTAMHEAGFIMTDTAPDYVVLGETRTYSFAAITKAIRLIGNGARFICTNPDAMNKLGAHSHSTGMIGDRMDTDVVAGIEAGLHTVLVLSGIATRAEVEMYPFRPAEILNSVADLLDA
jgi:NagD protein